MAVEEAERGSVEVAWVVVVVAVAYQVANVVVLGVEAMEKGAEVEGSTPCRCSSGARQSTLRRFRSPMCTLRHSGSDCLPARSY